MATRESPGRAWKEMHVRHFQEALERARRGAAMLDYKFGTRWDKLIDLETLDILSWRMCILGQLAAHDRLWFGFPKTAFECGFSCGVVMDIVGLLFRPARIVASYRRLTLAWKRVLRERRFQRLKALLPTKLPSSPFDGVPALRSVDQDLVTAS